MIWRTIFTFTLLSFVSCSSGYFSLRNNDRIVFFGDSITQLLGHHIDQKTGTLHSSKILSQ